MALRTRLDDFFVLWRFNKNIADVTV